MAAFVRNLAVIMMIMLAANLLLPDQMNPGVGYAFADDDGDGDSDSDSDSDNDNDNDSDHDDDDDGDNYSPSSNNGRDSDSIRSAVRRKQALPYWQIKSRIERRYKAKIVSVGVFKERRKWIYELKLIDNRGRLFEVHVDAKTARVIKTEN